MTRRKIRPDEQELWQQVAQSAQPLNPVQKVASPKDKPKKRPITIQEPFRPDPFQLVSKAKKQTPAFDFKPDLAQTLASRPLQMDQKNFKNLKRGKLVPEGKIDLHGMTLAQAHPALIRFIVGSFSEGKRLVLVITGKGKQREDFGPIPQQKGVLRHQVPQWMRMAPIAPMILQVTEAHVKHGGGGAYYVYLRRQR